ncbi:MerR family transcriptional regulator [Deinococcus cellulosilyticus]|uniref:MerR family transcriptional regulator n=1 Tax=Deinococcus cellulosilyticus (strain DSM 18568 / NBRC 106333 / KACC 11606 / 5516J-15) TaxID=1223518 RepID=A0A511MYA8_DEIC1|nr:MerR family transcriptional regulator [Deinococcus cellulosilyticus]GEM45553.1 MerR family transcriptional regulator [Deinococcus cellulosilyticus NBRC 106333 = KACC 11606]
MKIGALSRQTGASVRSIRHYDRLGLLASSREENGYRTFSDADVQRVHLIRLFLSVGFQLEEIRNYGPCWRGEVSPLDDTPVELTLAFYERKLTHIDQQLHGLQQIRDRLQDQIDTLRRLK